MAPAKAWDWFVTAHPTGFYSDLAKAQRNKLAAEAAQAAATEKARAAAAAQARLAAEGAKASEQAKAAAQSKAAEDERLVAERNRQEAERAKKLEEAKIASVPEAAPSAPRDASREGKSAEPAAPAVAALTPPAAAEEPKSDALAPSEIPRLLQTELRRVGCKTGDIDGEWNASARKALASFNEHAGTKFDVKLASLDALDAVKAKAGRVCPLDCDRGFRAAGDRCIRITCDEDQVLGPNGTCRPRPERPKVTARRERRSPAGHGGRCFVYNGASVCE